MIPSMGGGRLEPWFIRWAMDVKKGKTIVELGTWLGAGTIHLAANPERTVHTYDIFQIHGNEVDKAAAYGVKFSEGEDSLPWVQKHLESRQNIIYHKGKISDEQWADVPIGLYVDDACKYEPEFMDALKRFSPSWVPGETICAFMDYWWHLSRPNDERARFQKEFLDVHSECFDFIMEDRRLGIAAFRYKGGLSV